MTRRSSAVGSMPSTRIAGMPASSGQRAQARQHVRDAGAWRPNARPGSAAGRRRHAPGHEQQRGGTAARQRLDEVARVRRRRGHDRQGARGHDHEIAGLEDVQRRDAGPEDPDPAQARRVRAGRDTARRRSAAPGSTASSRSWRTAIGRSGRAPRRRRHPARVHLARAATRSSSSRPNSRPTST